MEVNVKVIARKCRLCAVDTLNTSFDIFHTCGLQMKIRKYLQITVKSSVIFLHNLRRHNWKSNIAPAIDGIWQGVGRSRTIPLRVTTQSYKTSALTNTLFVLFTAFASSLRTCDCVGKSSLPWFIMSLLSALICFGKQTLLSNKMLSFLSFPDQIRGLFAENCLWNLFPDTGGIRQALRDCQ